MRVEFPTTTWTVPPASVVSVISFPAVAFTVPTGFTIAAAGSWAILLPIKTSPARQTISTRFGFDTKVLLNVGTGFPALLQTDMTLEPSRIFDHEPRRIGVKKRQPSVKFVGRWESWLVPAPLRSESLEVIDRLNRQASC